MTPSAKISTVIMTYNMNVNLFGGLFHFFYFIESRKYPYETGGGVDEKETIDK